VATTSCNQRFYLIRPPERFGPGGVEVIDTLLMAARSAAITYRSFPEPVRSTWQILFPRAALFGAAEALSQ